MEGRSRTRGQFAIWQSTRTSMPRRSLRAGLFCSRLDRSTSSSTTRWMDLHTHYAEVQTICFCIWCSSGVPKGTGGHTSIICKASLPPWYVCRIFEGRISNKVHLPYFDITTLRHVLMPKEGRESPIFLCWRNTKSGLRCSVCRLSRSPTPPAKDAKMPCHPYLSPWGCRRLQWSV